MDNHTLDQNIQKINPQYKAIKPVSLRLNLKQIHNYDFNNFKKSIILININENEQILEKNKKNYLDDLAFIDKFNRQIQMLQICDNQSKTKDSGSRFMQIFNEKEKQKYQLATEWMKNMSPYQKEFFDLNLQIYEINKGIEQILKLQQKQQTQDFQNIILLHQNNNCGRLLHIESFVSNLLFNQRQLNFQSFHTLYINFTGENQQQHIDFWSLCHHNKKELSKFITFIPLYYQDDFYEINDDGPKSVIDSQIFEEQDENFLKDFNNIKPRVLFRKNTSQQTIFPLLYNSILSYEQMQIIYFILLLPIINSFKPKFIYLDLQISNTFQIELEGIEYLLRQLQKKANLIVYPYYKYETQKVDEQQSNNYYKSYINAILSGISGFKMMKTKYFNDDTPFKIYRWGNFMQKFYYQQNILMQKQIQFLQSQIQQYDQNKELQEIYQFAFRTQNKQIIWIIPQDNFLQNLKFTNYFCFYDQHQIILFDQNNQQIYSQHIQNYPQNRIKHRMPQQFNSVQVPNNLIEPSILIMSNYLIIIYGYEYSQNKPQLFDGIHLFDLQQPEEFILYKRSNNDQSQDLLRIIKNRRCPQICQNNGFQSSGQEISFLLIGGEFMNYDQNQNFIELVIVNLQNQSFRSNSIIIEHIHSQVSLKPWPNQLVLEYSFKKYHFYLMQTGNYLLKENKFEFPIDPNYNNYSQLLVQQDHSFKLYDVRVKRQNQYYFQIEQFYNNSRNWILERDQCSDQQTVWKAYITRIVNLKSPQTCQILQSFETQFQDIDFYTCFQICIELTIQLLIPHNYQDFEKYIVELDYKIISLQKIKN